MEAGPAIYALAVFAGLIAGVINTLAGSGSLITLGTLMAMGLPAPIANGTNRVGVLIQSGVALVTMRSASISRGDGLAWLVGAASVGALLGAWCAAVIDAQALEWIIIAVFWAMLVLLLINPRKWLREESVDGAGRPSPWRVLLMALVGVWGGFLQAGVGILLLAALVLVVGKDLIEATFIKLVVVLVYTVGTLLIFVVYDQIHWEIGLVMGIGQGAGGWIGGRFISRAPRAPIWIRRLLIVVIVAVCLELMGVSRWLISLAG